MTEPRFGRTIKVQGGIKATSTRGAIGESWWSRRFLAVLESFGMESRLARGRNYARAGQVLSLSIDPGNVTAQVQGSRPKPYDVHIGLSTYDSALWTSIERKMAAQALFLARLLAGEMPHEIEQVFAEAEAPLFPARRQDLHMSCSCPDAAVPCKHLAATCYLLAEAFDADPFEILHWRGRDRSALLENLRALRGTPKAGRTKKAAAKESTVDSEGIGAAAALRDLTETSLDDAVSRFWVVPVPLPTRPPVITTDVDLVLRQLPTPDRSVGGAALVDQLRALYASFRPKE